MLPWSARNSRSCARVLLFAALGANVAFRGGVGWPLRAGTLVSLAAAVLCATHARVASRASEPGADRALRVTWFAAAVAALSLIPLLQLLPLPPSAARAISPRAAETLADCARLLGTAAAWHPVSLDPGATAWKVSEAFAVALITCAVTLLGGSREERLGVHRAIAISGAGAVLVGLVAAALGAGPLVEPRTTFANPNHLAGFLQLAAWISFGFMLRQRGPSRVAWLAAFVLATAGVFLSLSRAGIAAYFVGAAAFPLLLRFTRRGAQGHTAQVSRARRHLWTVATSTGVAMALIAWLALDPLVHELRTVASPPIETKIALWPAAASLVRAHPLTGIGRGAFATVFAAYKTEPSRLTFTHVENTFLQALLDVGVLAGGAVLVVFGVAWIAGARAKGLSRPAVGGLAGVAALAAHDVLDFSLEIPAVALCFAAILAATSTDLRARTVRVAHVVAGVLFFVSAGLSTLVLGLRHDADRQGDAIALATTLDDAREAARVALAWHPADYLPVSLVGARLVQANRCYEAMPWLVVGMRRNPTAPEPHRFVARCLAAGRQDAAAQREFRLAFSFGDAEALDEAARWFPGEILAIAPATPDGLARAAALLSDEPAAAREAYQRAWDLFRSPAALAGIARTTLALGHADEALSLAREVQSLAPEEARGYLVASRALEQLDRDDEAVAELERGVARLPGRADVLVPLGLMHLSAQRPSQARLTFERIVARDSGELAQKHLLVARALEGQERYAEALRAAFDARDADPESAAPLEAIARIGARAGRYDEAIQALETASHKPGKTPETYAKWIDRLKTARTNKTVVDLERSTRP